MPTYGYRCGSCGHEFEIQQRMSDEPLKACPKCGGKLAKILYATSAIFKGSGYYTTDYKNVGKASGNGSVKSGEGSSETKPDAKPETKSESKSESRSETKTEPRSDARSESESKPKPQPKSDSSTEKKAS